MSMLAPMAYQACPVVKGSKTNVNYGFNRLRFVAPVRTGSRIRGHFSLKSFKVHPSGRWQAIYDVKVEIEAGPNRRSPRSGSVRAFCDAGPASVEGRATQASMTCKL